jgi:hypothetical protein
MTTIKKPFPSAGPVQNTATDKKEEAPAAPLLFYQIW